MSDIVSNPQPAPATPPPLSEMQKLELEFKNLLVQALTELKAEGASLGREIQNVEIVAEKAVESCWMHKWVYLNPSVSEQAALDALAPQNPRASDLQHRICRKCGKDENNLSAFIAVLKKARNIQT